MCVITYWIISAIQQIYCISRSKEIQSITQNNTFTENTQVNARIPMIKGCAFQHVHAKNRCTCGQLILYKDYDNLLCFDHTVEYVTVTVWKRCHKTEFPVQLPFWLVSFDNLRQYTKVKCDKVSQHIIHGSTNKFIEAKTLQPVAAVRLSQTDLSQCLSMFQCHWVNWAIHDDSVEWMMCKVESYHNLYGPLNIFLIYCMLHYFHNSKKT